MRDIVTKANRKKDKQYYKTGLHVIKQDRKESTLYGRGVI